MNNSEATFYERLPGFSDFRDFTRTDYYVMLPSDWYVVITDIQNSTEAILEGRYKDVNSLGVSSIVGVLNALKPLKIPYSFGGDGARLCIPPSIKGEVESALIATQILAEKSFGLHLRTGIVPMSVIESSGAQILVGKYQPNKSFSQAMFLGDGLGYAESLIKNADGDNPYILQEGSIEPNVSFEGFECRWNEIPSPHEEVITLLVQAIETSGKYNGEIYTEVFDAIGNIYGHVDSYHPIRQEFLTMTTSLKKLTTEIKIKSAFRSTAGKYLNGIKILTAVLSGKWLIRNKKKTAKTDWGKYKQSLIMNTDFRKIDESVKMVISGTARQRIELRNLLEAFFKERKIVFGIHASPTALITCVVSNYNDDHFHFLDGSNGGYALAAIEMKRQLKTLAP